MSRRVKSFLLIIMFVLPFDFISAETNVERTKDSFTTTSDSSSSRKLLLENFEYEDLSHDDEILYNVHVDMYLKYGTVSQYICSIDGQDVYLGKKVTCSGVNYQIEVGLFEYGYGTHSIETILMMQHPRRLYDELGSASSGWPYPQTIISPTRESFYFYRNPYRISFNVTKKLDQKPILKKSIPLGVFITIENIKRKFKVERVYTKPYDYGSKGGYYNWEVHLDSLMATINIKKIDHSGSTLKQDGCNLNMPVWYSRHRKRNNGFKDTCDGSKYKISYSTRWFGHEIKMSNIETEEPNFGFEIRKQGFRGDIKALPITN